MLTAFLREGMMKHKLSIHAEAKRKVHKEIPMGFVGGNAGSPPKSKTTKPPVGTKPSVPDREPSNPSPLEIEVLKLLRRGKSYMADRRELLAIADYKRALEVIAGSSSKKLTHSYRYAVREELARTYRAIGAYGLAGEYDPFSALSVSPTLLDWEFLPVGWWRDPAMAVRIEESLDKGQARLLMERLDFIESCQPSECFMSSFSRDKVPYYAYLFERCVIAENPLEGNAIYVIKGIEKWQSMLHLDKRTLRTRYADRVTKVVHRGEWKRRLRDLIRTT
jgi:tetratricopeptide (TPR) repeat protein